MSDTTVSEDTTPAPAPGGWTPERRRAFNAKVAARRARMAAAKAKIAASKTVEGEPPAVNDPGVPGAEVTYLDDEGPNSVTCGGVTFKLNVPQFVPRSVTVTLMESVETKGPEGDIRLRHMTVRRPLIDVLRTNACFSVDGHRIKRILGSQRLPQDPDHYRGWALTWIRNTVSLQELTERWNGEEPLRERIGVTEKDLVPVMPFLEMRRDILRGA